MSAEPLGEGTAAFVGVAAGEWGGLRPVEQLEMVFQYRSAHLFGRRVFLKGIAGLLDAGGRFTDPGIEGRLRRPGRFWESNSERTKVRSPRCDG